MNVIISNKQKNIIDNANIDAIKDLNGLFNVDDLIIKFKNYFFSKMILDATSIVDFSNPEVLRKLAGEIGGERLFILLPSEPLPPNDFVVMLNNLGIYNFSNNINELVDMINNPKTVQSKGTESYDNDFYVDNSIKNDTLGNVEMNNVPSYQNIKDNFDRDENSLKQDSLLEMINNSQNYTSNLEESDNSMIHQTTNNFYQSVNLSDKKIIGFKNVTDHAGSSTLIYLLVRILVKKHGKKALGLEINNNDFRFFQDKALLSINENELMGKMMSVDADIILVDLNNCQDNSFCQDIIYLIEPSIIMLNKIMMTNPMTFRNLKGKNLVLNKSVLSSSNVSAFANEAGTPIMFNIPYLNDRIDNPVLDELLGILKVI